MGVQPYLKTLFISCTYRISGLHYTYWCPAPSAAYDLLTESLDYTRLMDARPKVLCMFVESTYRINKSHYTYGYAALDAAYVGYLKFKNHLLTQHIYVSNLK